MTQLTRSVAASDSHLVQVLDRYLAAVQAGKPPDKAELLAQYPELADDLEACLGSLEFIREAAVSAARADAASPAAGTPMSAGTLGDYQIIREIGRGGMGIVYEADQISLSRRVALKVLPFAAALDAKQLQRFKNEAQAAAHLHHTNIVPVHAVGCERGVHYYAMQFIEGQTLAALIRELRQQAGKEDGVSRIEDRGSRIEDRRSNRAEAGGTIEDRGPVNETKPSGPLSSILHPLSSFFRTVANLGVQAAEALEHAHQLGVIHRDIKPANLLVDVRGNLWVTDFGLAQCQGQLGLTLTGDFVGTLRYMSPEQASARRGVVDHRTDIYSLGVTLYELLTLEPAYAGRDRAEVLQQITTEEPRLPRRLNPALPAELETIVLKALAKNPEERYGTAQDLADDLQRFLDDKPIRAKRPSLWQRAVKWARRHKTVVRAAVVVLVLAVAALAVSTAFIWQAKNDADMANADLSQSLERERHNAYYQRIALAEREWSANNLGRVEQLLDACPTDLRGWEWHYLKRLRLKGIPPLHHSAAVLSAAFSPDGRWIASGGQDGMVTVWDATTGQKRLGVPAHRWHVHSVAFSPDGRLLATASWDKTVKVWGFDPPRPAGVPPLIHTLPHQDRIHSVAFSPDGQGLASAGEDKTVRVWDTATGHEILALRGHSSLVWCVAYSPDGQYLASASADTTVKIWDARTGREMRTLTGHRESVFCVTFSGDGKQLASATTDIHAMTDGELKVWDAQTGREALSLRGHITFIRSVAFSPDGRRLASAGGDGTVKLWDLTRGQDVLTLRGHSVGVSSMAFSRDGNRLVSASGDGTVRVWNATPLEGEAKQELLTFCGHDGGVRSLAFSPDGRHLASAGDDATVRFWDFRRGVTGIANPPIQTLSGGKAMSLNVAFSKDGRFLASGSGGGRQGWLKVWDATTWEELHTNPSLTCPVAFSPDGQHLAAVSADFTIEIWDALATHRQSPPLKGHSWLIRALVFSPDSGFARLASASFDGTVLIWDVPAGRKIIALPHTGAVHSVAFSGDGRRLASGSLDGAVMVWDAKTWHLLDKLPDSTGRVESVAFHPKDDRVLAWGSSDSTVKVWNGATKEVRTLHGHTSWVESVAFSPDGEWIASASLDGTVKLWQVPLVPDGRRPGAGVLAPVPKGWP